MLRDDGTLWLNLGSSYAGYWGEKYAHKPFGEDRTPDETTPPHKKSPDFKTSSFKPKDMVPIPWMVAMALQADGWYLRSDIIWHKPNPMPESVTDRPGKSHEYIFLLTKSPQYFYDAEAVKEKAATSPHGPGYVSFDENSKRNDRTPNNEANGRDWAKDGKRNKRSVWTIATKPFSAAHFATFPPALIEPCILAGTSEKGCCAECGAPLVRVVERKRPPVDRYTNSSKPDDIKPCGGGGGMGQKLQNFYNENPAKTTGWKPTCKCNADKMPCTVLDIFGGAMTSAIVAYKHGRKFTMIELSKKYIDEIGIPRIENETKQLKLFN